jgi:hypothetical protein
MLIKNATVAACMLLAAVALAAPAQAQSRNTGGCAPDFTAYTLLELIELGNTFGNPPEATTAVFDGNNRNGDELICVRPMPQVDLTAFLFVDNNAHVPGR